MLHNNLKKLRVEYDISAQRIAKFMKVREQDILDWESGKSEPSLQQLRELADLYDVKCQDLLDIQPEENQKEIQANKNAKNSGSTKHKTKRKTKKKQKVKKVNQKTVEKKHNWPLYILICILLVAAGVGGYLYWKYGDEYSLIKKEDYTVDEMVGTFTNESSYEGTASTLTLQSNGTYQISYNDCSIDSVVEGSWNVKDNTITLQGTSDEITLTISSYNKLKFNNKMGCSIKKSDVFTRGSTQAIEKNETEDTTQTDNTKEEVITSNMEVGQWSGNNTTLNIKSIDGTNVVFTLQSYDPTNAKNVASLEDIEGSIDENTLSFQFRDDGFGNAGEGTLVFEPTQAILHITLTTINKDAPYSIALDATLMK